MNRTLKLLLFVFSAMLVGFINGLLGGGGGMLCIPIFKALLKIDDKKAHATAVLVMAVISIPTLIVYITTIPFNFLNALFLSLGVLLGGLIGSALLKKLNNKVINIIFILVMFVSGIKMLV